MTVSLSEFDFDEAPGERPINLWCDCGELGTREEPTQIVGINSLRLFIPSHKKGCKPHVDFKP